MLLLLLLLAEPFEHLGEASESFVALEVGPLYGASSEALEGCLFQEASVLVVLFEFFKVGNVFVSYSDLVVVDENGNHQGQGQHHEGQHDVSHVRLVMLI